MRLNYKKFFELAKQNGFEAADVTYRCGHSLSVSIFHGEIDSYTVQNTAVVNARGIINGKFGNATTEIIDKSTPEFLIENIKETASYIESDDPSIIFKGSKKYHKKNFIDKSIAETPISSKIQTLFEIEKKLLAYDKRINEVMSVSYAEENSENHLLNSYGLKLSNKSASAVITCEVSAKEGDEVRTNYELFVDLSLSNFDIDKFVKEVAEGALKKLGSVQCKSKKYEIVLGPTAGAQLLACYLSSADAEEVQKKSSLFIDKVGKQVASKKLTVIENPLEKNIFYTYFDDEGVATYKKYLIKKGILETYIYTLETAAKAGVEPTGNGYRGGGKASAGLGNTIVKPGKKSEEEMISKIKEGVYISELEGLHAGMNEKSGNFSLQTCGFMIRDGKIAEPLSLITLAGNLVDVFNGIKEIANNSKLDLRTQITIPSIRIKKLAVSGK